MASQPVQSSQVVVIRKGLPDQKRPKGIQPEGPGCTRLCTDQRRGHLEDNEECEYGCAPDKRNRYRRGEVESVNWKKKKVIAMQQGQYDLVLIKKLCVHKEMWEDNELFALMLPRWKEWNGVLFYLCLSVCSIFL